MNAKLGGNCQVPVAGFAQIINNILVLKGRVGHPERNHLLEAQSEGSLEDASMIGEQVAEDLIEQGARKMIEDIIGCG
jgi:hydroxymethylbilane synthase